MNYSRTHSLPAGMKLELTHIITADESGHALFSSEEEKIYYMCGMSGKAELVKVKDIPKTDYWREPANLNKELVFPSVEDARRYMACLFSQLQLNEVNKEIEEDGRNINKMQMNFKSHYENELKQHSNFRYFMPEEKNIH